MVKNKKYISIAVKIILFDKKFKLINLDKCKIL